jgi:hypothetical protein
MAAKCFVHNNSVNQQLAVRNDIWRWQWRSDLVKAPTIGCGRSGSTFSSAETLDGGGTFFDRDIFVSVWPMRSIR